MEKKEEKGQRHINRVDSTGKQVAENIKRLRGGMTYKTLTKKLAYLGRPINEISLRNIEDGIRKVDSDDLVAFALVFGVSPLTLLMPPSHSAEKQTRITGINAPVSCEAAWNWGKGEKPLPEDPMATHTPVVTGEGVSTDAEIHVGPNGKAAESDDQHRQLAIDFTEKSGSAPYLQSMQESLKEAYGEMFKDQRTLNVLGKTMAEQLRPVANQMFQGISTAIADGFRQVLAEQQTPVKKSKKSKKSHDSDNND